MVEAQEDFKIGDRVQITDKHLREQFASYGKIIDTDEEPNGEQLFCVKFENAKRPANAWLKRLHIDHAKVK